MRAWCLTVFSFAFPANLGIKGYPHMMSDSLFEIWQMVFKMKQVPLTSAAEHLERPVEEVRFLMEKIGCKRGLRLTRNDAGEEVIEHDESPQNAHSHH